MEGADVNRTGHIGVVSVAGDCYVTGAYVEPPLPALSDDPFDMPAFLQRRLGGGWVYPSLHIPKQKEKIRATQAGNTLVVGTVPDRTYFVGGPDIYRSDGVIPIRFWKDRDILTALSDPAISVQARQPFLKEGWVRQERAKSEGKRFI